MSSQGSRFKPEPESVAPGGATQSFALRHPLVFVALAYGGGVVLGWRLEGPLPVLFGAAALLSLWAVVDTARRIWLLGPLLLLLGWVNMAQQQAKVSPWDLRGLVADKPELVTLQGRLVETPTHRIFLREEQESWRSHAVVEVLALRRRGEWQAACGRVAVTTPGQVDAGFYAGRLVELTGVLKQPPGALAEGLFDYRQFLRWQGIHFQLQCQGTRDWRLVPEADAPLKPPLPDRFRTWAQGTLGRGLPVEDEELRLLWAMTLGWRTALTDEVAEPFMRSGTMHVFAISGLHIVLIAGMLVAVLRAMQLPRSACGALIIPLIWFYTLTTGWQPSAVRSTIMMTVIIVGWTLQRPGNLLNSLAASGLFILVADPSQLFQASFQLSFFVVLSLALLLPPFERLRQRLLQTDPFLPDELRPRWQQWLDEPVRFVTTNFATSLAAWVGSLPLIAHYFHLFTPASLLANLFVVPLSSLALMCNLGALFCGDWLPWLAEVFNHSGWLFMRGMIAFSHWTTTLPGAFWYLRAPEAWELGAYYGLVLLLAAGWFWTPGRRAVAWGVLTVAMGGWIAAGWQGRDTVRLTVLGRGAGSIFCAVPGHGRWLMDCGSESASGFLVKPFLRGQGVNRLEHLVLTHGDQRRVGGFNLLWHEFQPGQVWTSPVASRSSAYRAALAFVKKESLPWTAVSAGGRASGWEVLHPAVGDKFERGDDNALVLRGEFHGVRVLLLSELGALGQRALLDRGSDLRADIIVAGMPEQGEPLSDHLLAAVQPRLIVLTDAEFPLSKRARPQLRARLERHNVPVLRLAESGSLTLLINADKVVVSDVRGQPLAHWPSVKQ